MNNYNNNPESEISDNDSVFSFCCVTKHHSLKKNFSPSLTTISNSNYPLTFNLKGKSIQPSLDKDEILSMMDFFIDAKDFNSQIHIGSSLLSNYDGESSAATVKVNECQDISMGLDLVNFKKARNLFNLRYHRIHNKVSLAAKVHLKRRIELKNVFLDMGKTLRKLNVRHDTDIFHN